MGASLFERLLRNPPTGVDVMLMEGSSLGWLDENTAFPTEMLRDQKRIDTLGYYGAPFSLTLESNGSTAEATS